MIRNLMNAGRLQHLCSFRKKLPSTRLCMGVYLLTYLLTYLRQHRAVGTEFWFLISPSADYRAFNLGLR